MSATTLTPPIRVDTAPRSARPGIGRLVAVELRKMLDTRAGLWLQVATLALTVAAVAIRCVVGGADDHGFVSVLQVGLQPANVLLPIVGILLVTSEWSQRTGLITFTLVPVRSRVLAAKLLASLVLVAVTLAGCLAIVAAGVLVAAPGVEGTWSSAAPMVGQAAAYLAISMVVGVALGAAILASAPAIVANFALPTLCAALASLSVFAGVAPWLDYAGAFGPMAEEILSPTQWAHAGTALIPWMALPLLIGFYRITRREVPA